MKKKFTILKYDSALFGYKVANLEIDKVSDENLFSAITELKIRSVKLVYLKMELYNKQIEETIKRNRGFLVDVKVLYSYEIKNEPLNIDMKNIEPIIGKKVDEDLKNIAVEAGAYSRYKKDPNFHNREFEKLFYDWIRKSLNKQIADFVFVYKYADSIVGLITAKIKGSILEIGLLSVAKKYRSQHIGSKLMDVIKKIAFESKFFKINVYTQEDNIPACKFYEKLGFKVTEKEYIYHIWVT